MKNKKPIYKEGEIKINSKTVTSVTKYYDIEAEIYKDYEWHKVFGILIYHDNINIACPDYTFELNDDNEITLNDEEFDKLEELVIKMDRE